MTKLLELYLKMAKEAVDAPHATKELAKQVPANKTYWHKGEIKPARELLLSEGLNSTTLIQTEMMATVLEGAEPFKCMREALPIFKAKSNILRVPYGESGSYAEKVAEGTAVPIRTQTYSYRDFNIYTYGDRPLITVPMVEDSQYDVIALEIAKCGARVENLLNQQALSLILQNSGNSVDCGGAGATPVAKLAEAIGANATDGYMSDTIILTPGMYAAVVAAFTSLATPMGETVTRTGKVGTLLGCNTFLCGVTDDSATYTWGWGTNDYIGGLVINKSNAGATAIRRDITVKNFDDVIKEMVGMTVTARLGFNYLAANAICRVLY